MKERRERGASGRRGKPGGEEVQGRPAYEVIPPEEEVVFLFKIVSKMIVSVSAWYKI